MSNPPTLKSIAQRVGMTANTVSLALRDSPLVAENTKARIQKAAEEMGYVQNAIAGSLRSGRTNTVAVVTGDIANPLFAAKIKALEHVLREEGYQIIIFNSDEDPSASWKRCALPSAARWTGWCSAHAPTRRKPSSC